MSKHTISDMNFQVFPMQFPAQGMCHLITAHDRRCGTIIGAVTTLEKGPVALEFARLFVAEKHRRNGIGRLLVRWVEMHARDSGYRAISCLVAGRNPDARKFYEALGFTPAYQFDDGDIIYTKPIPEVQHG